MQGFKKSIGYILITAFCFGTMEVALKLAGSHFNAIQITFLRFLIGGIILLPLAIFDLKKRKYKLTFGDFIYLLLLGIICVCLSMSLCQIGVMKTNASLAAIIISINPVFTMIFAHFLTNDKFTLRKLLVLVFCIAGLIVCTGVQNIVNGNNITGIVLVLIASVAFGLYTAFGKRRISKIGGMSQNCFSFLLGCAVLLTVMLFTGIPVFTGITPDSIPLLLYLGIVVTGLGYFALMKAVAKSGPSVASIAFFVKPIIALAAAALLLNENISINMVCGVALILAGLIINMLPTEKNKGVIKNGKKNCTNNS